MLSTWHISGGHAICSSASVTHAYLANHQETRSSSDNVPGDRRRQVRMQADCCRPDWSRLCIMMSGAERKALLRKQTEDGLLRQRQAASSGHFPSPESVQPYINTPNTTATQNSESYSTKARLDAQLDAHGAMRLKHCSALLTFVKTCCTTQSVSASHRHLQSILWCGCA